MAGVKEMCAHLHSDKLHAAVVQAFGIKDAVQGTVNLAALMPVITDTFHRQWRLAQVHQDALLRAVDIDNAGLLSFEAFELAAAFAMRMHPPAQALPPGAVRQWFQAACKLDNRGRLCTLQHARWTLFPRVSRIWTAEGLLQPGDIELDLEGVPRLSEESAFGVQEQATKVQGSIVTGMQVRRRSVS